MTDAPAPSGNSLLQEESSFGGETRLVIGDKEVEAVTYGFIERSMNDYIFASSDDRTPGDTSGAVEFARMLFQKNPKFKMRLIVDLQNKNLEYYRKLIDAGVELRHIESNKVSFAISKNEYLAAPLAAIEEQVSSGALVPREIVWSTRQDMVGQFSQIFDVMWGGAQKASSRIKQLEEGIEPESTLVIQDMRRVYEIGQRMNDECKEEALMILASEMTVVRNAAMFEKLVQRQKDTGFTIRVLSPQITQKATSILPTAQWKKLEEPINVSILIYDRSRMFITQYSNLEAKTTEEAVSTNIYCTSKPTILGMISVFEALWRETELRQREERSRRQAELLQDVLTHDIRNYNQVSRIAVESIAERLAAQGESEYHQIASGALGAIDGSTQLVDKARKLGKILAEQGRIHLNNVDLIESIDRSFLLVKSAFPQKRIKATRRVIGEKVESPILVRADELLDEVFVNLFSNSAKFADGENVTIEVVIVEEGSFRSVLIKDSGPGIPPEQSETIFERYSKGRKGSGLGLSIVHALVVGRYGGQAKIINADNNGIEHISFVSTKGAIVSLLLQKGFAEESEKGFESKGGHLE